MMCLLVCESEKDIDIERTRDLGRRRGERRQARSEREEREEGRQDRKKRD